ncbi:FMN-binding protein [Halorhodospira neutriphila]|uniref:Ion-translocating oxidoreductase complex subunit G n=1 Tax=Halorhodospira neutriphila TaxID=168379 RepID=A0ABS1E7W2_9GAMM|nr:FMN-binding protein [Halorhodospira neutriphila]MBK1726521.1 FMN-binding protein [Halorhodospira neutriphila]
MSAPASQQQQPPAPTSSLRLIATLGVIALISGLLVVSVVELTRPIIAENQRAALRAGVLKVIPGAEQRRDYVLTGSGLVPKAQAAASGPVVHAGYDADGDFRGVAIEAAGRGYAGTIRLLYGYDPAREEIVGMTVLESKETPGLGDRIETDPQFKANFKDLEASLGPEGEALAHPIRTVEPGESDEPGEIDGITGATISSNAVGRILDNSAGSLLPRLAPHWSDLQGER